METGLASVEAFISRASDNPHETLLETLHTAVTSSFQFLFTSANFKSTQVTRELQSCLSDFHFLSLTLSSLRRYSELHSYGPTANETKEGREVALLLQRPQN